MRPRLRSHLLFYRKESYFRCLDSHECVRSLETVFDLAVQDCILHLLLQLTDRVAWSYAEEVHDIFSCDRILEVSDRILSY